MQYTHRILYYIAQCALAFFHAATLFHATSKRWDWGPTSNPFPSWNLIWYPHLPHFPHVFTTTQWSSSQSRASLGNCRARQQEEAMQNYIENSVLIRLLVPLLDWIQAPLACTTQRLWKVATTSPVWFLDSTGVLTHRTKSTALAAGQSI